MWFFKVWAALRAALVWFFKGPRRYNNLYIGTRKKSNCKDKSWEQTEPILLRYFTGLRQRLQLGDESLYPELQ